MNGEQKMWTSIVFLVLAFLTAVGFRGCKNDEIRMEKKTERYRICIGASNPPERCAAFEKMNY